MGLGHGEVRVDDLGASQCAFLSRRRKAQVARATFPTCLGPATENFDSSPFGHLSRFLGAKRTRSFEPPSSAVDPQRSFLLRGCSEGKSARYRLARISTSRSTYRHSAVLRSRRTISSKASACSGAYSNQVRKSNGSPSSRL